MKTIQSKSLLTLIIIFFIIGFSTSAKNFIGLPESFTDSLPEDKTSLYVLDNPQWVVFPELLEEHREESRNYIKNYSRRERGYIIHMFSKGKKYFPQALEIFEKYNVPSEFQVLPALESNFNGNAVSRAGAVGYWQFMSELAREYGLKVGGKNDERKNFEKSTIAAAKYFRDQLDYFNNDILLAVASYNCGTGRVRYAIKKSGMDNPDYWDIQEYLPQETKRFVMKFVSLNVIQANYDKFLNNKLDLMAPETIQLADIDSSIMDNFLSRNSL